MIGLGSFWPITAIVPVKATVIIAAVIVASVVGAIVVAARRAICARIFVEAHLSFLGVSVLVGSCDHLANACRWLVVELGMELTVMKSSDEGDDYLSFSDVRNRVPHLRQTSDVATEELGWLLVDAAQIMLGVRPSTRSHVVIGVDLL